MRLNLRMQQQHPSHKSQLELKISNPLFSLHMHQTLRPVSDPFFGVSETVSGQPFVWSKPRVNPPECYREPWARRFFGATWPLARGGPRAGFAPRVRPFYNKTRDMEPKFIQADRLIALPSRQRKRQLSVQSLQGFARF